MGRIKKSEVKAVEEQMKTALYKILDRMPDVLYLCKPDTVIVREDDDDDTSMPEEVFCKFRQGYEPWVSVIRDPDDGNLSAEYGDDRDYGYLSVDPKEEDLRALNRFLVDSIKADEKIEKSLASQMRDLFRP